MSIAINNYVLYMQYILYTYLPNLYPTIQLSLNPIHSIQHARLYYRAYITRLTEDNEEEKTLWLVKCLCSAGR